MKKLLLSFTLFSCIALLGDIHAEGFNFSDFSPLNTSANSRPLGCRFPWKLPAGHQQSIVSDETHLNIYNLGRSDRHDMNTVNETGPHAGRFLYRTHETRFPQNQPIGGALSVVDLKTGKTQVLAKAADFDALDGIRWTPWGTLLFAEEKTKGRFFEIELNADLVTVKKIHDRPAVGRLAHEGIELDAMGNLYVVDEHRGRSTGCDDKMPCGGGVYKFVPDKPADLSTGNLYVLKVTGPDGTGQGVWVGPVDPMNARVSGSESGGQSYQRPEDLEIINNVLYVAITEGPRDKKNQELYEGRVISIDLDTMVVRNFVKPDVNVSVEIGKPGETGHQSGFDSVDNLAEAPNGDLVMIEDNSPSDIWFASTKNVNQFGASREVKLFASLTDPEGEGTGIYFSPHDPSTLYVNIQHSAAINGDGTWAITRKAGKHWKRKDD